MDVKPGYKQTEVGVIPEDWEVTTAAAVCDLVVDCKNRTPPVVDGGDYAVVRTPNVRNGKFVREELRFTDEQSFREWTARAIPQIGDILITREAPLGEVCLVPADVRVCLGQRMMLYRTDQETADCRFLLYALMSSGVQRNLLRKIGGSTVGHAKVDDIRNLQVPLPPTKAEQEAIAEALSDADALIESLDQLLVKRRQLKQGAMQQLLTGKTRLQGFSGEWETIRLLALADHRKALFDDGDWIEAEFLTENGIRLVQTGNIGEGKFIDRDSKKYISPESFEKLRCKSLKVGDILICRLAEPAGRACILPDIEEEWMITAVDVTIFRPPQSVADRRFLVNIFNTSDWFEAVTERCGGSTRTRIARAELGKIEIKLPPLSEQMAIADILSDMQAEIATLERRRDKTRAIKQGMMQALLTGRIRLFSDREGNDHAP